MFYRVRTRLPGTMYQPGFNTALGDPEPFWGFLNGKFGREGSYGDVPYHVEPSHSDSELEHGDRVRQRTINQSINQAINRSKIIY